MDNEPVITEKVDDVFKFEVVVPTTVTESYTLKELEDKKLKLETQIADSVAYQAGKQADLDKTNSLIELAKAHG